MCEKKGAEKTTETLLSWSAYHTWEPTLLVWTIVALSTEFWPLTSQEIWAQYFLSHMYD